MFIGNLEETIRKLADEIREWEWEFSYHLDTKKYEFYKCKKNNKKKIEVRVFIWKDGNIFKISYAINGKNEIKKNFLFDIKRKAINHLRRIISGYCENIFLEEFGKK